MLHRPRGALLTLIETDLLSRNRLETQLVSRRVVAQLEALRRCSCEAGVLIYYIILKGDVGTRWIIYLIPLAALGDVPDDDIPLGRGWLIIQNIDQFGVTLRPKRLFIGHL